MRLPEFLSSAWTLTRYLQSHDGPAGYGLTGV